MQVLFRQTLLGHFLHYLIHNTGVDIAKAAKTTGLLREVGL